MPTTEKHHRSATAAHPSTVAENLAHVHRRIASAATRVGREPCEVMLVAVSKTKPMSLIEEAWQAGQMVFGENRFEDALPKIAQSHALGWANVQWHFIGSIQSRKTAQALNGFTLIHSVDRLKIANRLSRDSVARNKVGANDVLSLLLQVNVSGEESKHGFTPAELRQQLSTIAALPGISVEGLMTMAPFTATAEETRPVFRGLRILRDELAEKHPELSLHHLSMGMTNDFEVAIEEGATIVRIGSAIFGARN